MHTRLCPLQSFSTKLMIAIIIATQLMLPLSARAVVGSVPEDPCLIWSLTCIGSTTWLLRYFVNPIVRGFTRSIITSLTQQVVNWISADGGNNVGFVGNFEQTLTNELDNSAGEFLDQIPYIDFCGDIGAYLKLNLRVPGGNALRQRARCSLTAVVKNVQNFYDNFQNGGWEAFLKANVDIQNNTAGAFLIALDAKVAQESRKKESFVLRYQQSLLGGVLGKTEDKINCVYVGITEDGVPKSKCTTQTVVKTPGTIIEQTIKDANKTGIDFGIAAKDFDESIGAIMSALLKRTISSAGGIFGQSSPGQANYGDPLYNYKEITASQDSLRSRVDAGIFVAYGTEQAIDTSVLSLRKELTATTPPSAARETEIKNKTADLLAKKQTVTTQENEVITMKQSSFNAVMQSDIARIDQQVTQTMNIIEPISKEVNASPYASPTNDMKTDNLNDLSGARTKIASSLALANQAIAEVDRALSILNAEIAASQAQLGTLQPQLATLQSQLTGFQAQLTALQSQLSGLQSQLSTLQSQKDTLDSQLAILKSQLASLQSQLAATTNQSQQTSLQQQIAQLQAQIVSIQQQIGATQAQITATQGQIAVTQAQIAATQGQITTTQAQIAATQGQVTTTSQQIKDLNALILTDQGNIQKVIDYRATLTTGNTANPKGVVSQLQEADSALQNEYNTVQKFVTSSEAVGETGNTISVIFTANDAQRNANAFVRDTFGFLDSILGKTKPSFQPSPAVNPSGPLPIPPAIDEAPALPPSTDSGGSGE